RGLAEKQNITADHFVHFDPDSQWPIGSANTTFGQAHRQATIRDVMSRAKNAPIDRFKTTVLNRLLQLEIDPQRRSLHQAMNQLEILAAAELLASSPNQDDD